jgi:pimeloyl-ACP methyl ester carboxylesterase
MRRPTPQASGPHPQRVTTFALVHGGWHDASCWDSLTPLLEEAGHDVIAVDLPCDDESASFDTYADVVCAALDGCDDDVFLVAHSLGGHTAPLVASRRRVRHLVYLCALVPEIGRSVFDQLLDEPTMLNPAYRKGVEFDAQGRQVWADLDVARAMFYNDCDEPTAEAALKRLRPQAAYPGTATCTLAEYPSVSCTYVVCTDDQILGNEWSRRIARDRLGADLIEMPGSHSPFLSRPSALADVLLSIAER